MTTSDLPDLPDLPDRPGPARLPALPEPVAAEVAPGVYRIADWMVNVYLVVQDGRITVIDTGLPGLYPRLLAGLAEIGHALGAVEAVLITHGHPDHTGLAERLREEAGAGILVHEADAPLLADPKHLSAHWRPERSMLPYLLRRPATLRTPLHLLRQGGFRPRPVADVGTFTAGPLDVPGTPTAIPVPGHTAGSSAFLFPEHGVLFSGDALVTRDDVTGRSGPRIVAGAFTQNSAQALASLTRLTDLGPALVLPGHGEPFAAGIRAAVTAAEAVGPQ